jgi:hypothetical protein
MSTNTKLAEALRKLAEIGRGMVGSNVGIEPHLPAQGER